MLFQRRTRVGNIYFVPIGDGKFTIAKVLGLGNRQIGPLGGDVMLFEVYELLLNKPTLMETKTATVISRWCSFRSFVEEGKWKLAQRDRSTVTESPDSERSLCVGYDIFLDHTRHHLGLPRVKYTGAEFAFSKHCPQCGQKFRFGFARCAECNAVRVEFIGFEQFVSDVAGHCALSGSPTDVKAPNGKYYYAPYFIDMVHEGKFPELLSINPLIRLATPDDTEMVSFILQEAARWLEQTGKPMWRDSELLPSRIAEDVHAGLFFIAVLNTEPAGVIKFQLEDPLFWPDLPQTDSAFVHRLAVRRRFAGDGVSTALLTWAAESARALNKRYLRLDCEATRPKLRAVYERFGFRHHSDRQVGPYFVSRYEYDLAL